MSTKELRLTETQREMLRGPDARMDAYYYGFDRTGVPEIDAILSAVAYAGKGWHSTEDWYGNPEDFNYGPFIGQSPGDVIQAAANEAAAERQTVTREVLVKVIHDVFAVNGPTPTNGEVADAILAAADLFEDKATVQAEQIEKDAAIAEGIKGSHYPMTMGWASAERVAAAIRAQ